MITIAVCDDEPVTRAELLRKIDDLLARTNTTHQLDEFVSGEGLLASPNSYDIVFIDLQMEDDAMGAVRQLQKQKKNAIIVFITSFDSYMYETFGSQAFNYLLKPVEEDKLSAVLYAAVKRLSGVGSQGITILKDRQPIRVNLEDVLYFELLGRDIAVHRKEDLIDYTGSAKKLEHELLGAPFARCHKRYLVNLQVVYKIGKGSVQLDNGEALPLAERYWEGFSRAALGAMKKAGVWF